MLKQRLITGLVLLALCIVVLFWFNLIEFAIAIGLMVLAMNWEWSNLIGLKLAWQRVAYTLVAAAVMFVFALLPSLILLIVGVVVWCALIGVVSQYARGVTSVLVSQAWCSALIGLLLCPILWVAMNSLFAVSDGRYWLLYSLIVVWVMDIGGYFVGRQWGKHPLCAKVSPKKTREGLYGGLVCLLPFVALGGWVLHVSGWQWLWLLLASYIAAVFAVFGDLFESVLKRHADVKDSGQLLPGHGGVLDRMDGVLSALPVMAIACILLV